MKQISRISLILFIGVLLALSINISAQDADAARVIASETAGEVVELYSFRLGESTTGVTWSPDGARLAASASSFTQVYDIDVFHLTDRDGISRMGTTNAFTLIGTDATYSADGAMIATRSSEGPQVWDAETGGKLQQMRFTTGTTGVSFSPDGATLAAGHMDSAMRLWDVETGEELMMLDLPANNDPGSPSFVPGSNEIMFSSFGPDLGGVYFWDLDPESDTYGEISRELIEGGRIGLTAEGAQLVVAASMVRFFDLETFEMIHNLTISEDYVVGAFAVSPDESLVALGTCVAIYQANGSLECDGGAILLYDVETSHLLATLEGHTGQFGGVRAVAFNPDGTILASAGGQDETIRLWGVPVGQDQCNVFANGTVNLRSGPGTNYERAGQMTMPELVVGQTTGADGFVWWQLRQDRWVRSDLTFEEGDCENIPEVEVE